ncbi:hypothetical protein EDD22DRAFT_847215 [Suillus occidentalis]|nr:hypothetical protein EDD22DRAFT_847215 [Suillus occidentalis]
MSNTAISPTEYTNILISQISPQYSLDPQFDFRSSHDIQHTQYMGQSSTSNEGLWALLDWDPLPDDSMILQLNRGSTSSTASSSSLSVASDTTDQKLNLLDVTHEDSNHDLNTIDYLLVKSWMKKDRQENMLSSLAPESIGQALLKVIHWLIHMLCKQYSEFRLCANNWKAMKLMIDNYSQWYHYHIVKKQTIKSEDESPTPAVTPPSSSSSMSAVTPPLSSSSMPSLKRVHVGIDPLAEPVLKRQQVEVEDLDDDDLYIPLGKEKEVIAVNNPLSNIVFKPRPKPITKKVPTSSCVTDSLTSGTTTSESTTTAPPSNNLSDTDPSSLAVKMELMAANPPKSIPPNTINSKTQPIKKHQPNTKPMRISSKIMACCRLSRIEFSNIN